MLTEGSISSAPIEVCVGKDKVSFFVHESVLCKSSKFFDAALKKEWEEGQRRIIHLPDDDPDEVYAYIRWLYWKKLFVKTTDDEGKPVLLPVVRLYVLGERLLDDSFQDCVLNSSQARNRTRMRAGQDFRTSTEFMTARPPRAQLGDGWWTVGFISLAPSSSNPAESLHLSWRQTSRMI